MSSIEIKNLTKVLGGKTILNNLNLTIEEGCFFTLLGSSGCGKTTTLKTIAGIYSIDEGEILIDGKNVRNIPMEKRNTPFVFQDHLLFPHMKVFDNIAFGLKIKKLPKSEINNRVSKIIELLELKGLEKSYPHQLSGGQKQRVSLGRALVTEPKVLLLDEPFSSLDINLRETMRNLIKDLHNTFKLTIVFVTHDKEEALTISDKIALMSEGKILQVGTPYEIYEKPNSLEVANFFGNCNVIEGLIEDNHFINDIFNINLKVDKSYSYKSTLISKAEDIEIILEENSSIVIYKKLYIGDRYIYTLKSQNSELKVICNKYIDLPLGAKVKLKFLKEDNLIIF